MALTARRLYEEDLGRKLGINIDTEYGRKKLNEYLERQRKADEHAARLHLQKYPGGWASFDDIDREVRKIQRKRLEFYEQEIKRREQRKNYNENISIIFNNKNEISQEQSGPVKKLTPPKR